MLRMNFLILGNGRISCLINGLLFVMDIIEMAATIQFFKIAQMFATLRKLSIYISVNE